MTNTNKMTKKDWFKLLAGIVEKTETTKDFDKDKNLNFLTRNLQSQARKKRLTSKRMRNSWN